MQLNCYISDANKNITFIIGNQNSSIGIIGIKNSAFAAVTSTTYNTCVISIVVLQVMVVSKLLPNSANLL